MNKFLKITFSVMMVMGLAILSSSCKKDFDQPPGPTDANIAPNTTIAALKAMHTSSGAYDIIATDVIISGIVVANDKSGNIYKQLFIQDSTGAMQLLLDANSLYTSYPVGRRVYVKAKGLSLSDFNGTMSLGVKATVGGLPSQEGIPSNLINKYVIGGSINNPVVPILVTESQLTTNMQDRYINALIQLNDYEFVGTDTSKTYSDTSAYKATQNRFIKPCSGSQVTVRTSAYANFAGVSIPNGHGNIVAIYTVFGSTKQLILRDTSDVMFNDPRCGAIPSNAVILLNQDFESQVVPASAPYNPISVTGWTNLAEVGGKLYAARTFGGTKYAEITAFGSAQNVVISWLVTSAVNLNNTTSEVLRFASNQGFIGAGGSTASTLKVLVSSNYTGTGNPWAAGVTWTDITSQATLSPGAASGYPSSFTNSGNVSLAGFSGTVYVAFKYDGADPAGTAGDRTSTWQIDNIVVYGF